MVACAKLFKEAVAQFGVHAFAYGEINLAEHDRNVRSVERCVESGYLKFHLKGQRDCPKVV